MSAELLARLGPKLAKGYAVTASSEVAGMGLLERESAAILNACVQVHKQSPRFLTDCL